jgi:hypothetical protein
MYPPVRQFESSELSRYLVEKDAERTRRGGAGVDAPQRAWMLLMAVPFLVVGCLLAAVLIDGFAG